MKTLLRAGALALALLSCVPAIAQVDPTVTGLPSASALTGAELLPVYQGGQRVLTNLNAACSTKSATAAVPTLVGLPGAGVISGGELAMIYQGRSLSVTTVNSLCSSHAAFAGAPSTIGLPGAGVLIGTELVPLYQGGRPAVATIAQIASLFSGTTPVVTQPTTQLAGTLDFTDPNQAVFAL